MRVAFDAQEKDAGVIGEVCSGFDSEKVSGDLTRDFCFSGFRDFWT
jgi:hypothetical protein